MWILGGVPVCCWIPSGLWALSPVSCANGSLFWALFLPVAMALGKWWSRILFWTLFCQLWQFWVTGRVRAYIGPYSASCCNSWTNSKSTSSRTSRCLAARLCLLHSLANSCKFIRKVKFCPAKMQDLAKCLMHKGSKCRILRIVSNRPNRKGAWTPLFMTLYFNYLSNLYSKG